MNAGSGTRTHTSLRYTILSRASSTAGTLFPDAAVPIIIMTFCFAVVVSGV